MNDVIIRLKKERDALRERLAKVDAAIEEYERWALSVAALVGSGEPLSVSDAGIATAEEPTPMAAFEKEVRALFDRVSAPLRRTEVHEALAKAGVVVGGKDPLNTVASRLSRMAGITNLKGHGYWTEDRPYPPAGYRVASTPEAGLFDGDATSRAEGDTTAEHGELPATEE